MDDDTMIENRSSRVLGIGSGTFVVAILFFSTLLVWIFTSPQSEPLKSIMRTVSSLISITIFAILLLADKQSQYQSTGSVVQVYDNTVGPRIAIGSLMIFSTFISLLMVFLAQFSTYQVLIDSLFYDLISCSLHSFLPRHQVKMLMLMHYGKIKLLLIV